MTTVAVCVVTYRRPDGLAALLDATARLTVPPGVDLKVVVVDNDAEGGAAPVVEAATPRSPWPVVYDVEPRHGIPHARNRAVGLASGADFVAFIDDDETPEPDWVERVIAVQRRTGADVVMGPSVPVFDGPVPDWVVQGGFFDRVRFSSGQEIPYNYVRTSGVLVGASLFAGDEPPFDEAYAVSGGSDRHFFHRADLDGRRFVWADEAVVVERVPPSRATVRWLLHRAYRTGNSRSLTLVDLEGTPLRRAKRVGAGAWSIAKGLARAVPATVQGRAALVHALREAAYGAGLITGVLGVRAREYTSVHGH